MPLFFAGPIQSAVAFEVTRFAQEGDGSVNSWILEGDEGVVVIDTQRSLSAGREIAAILQTIDKPLRAILLTHPHPDHFGGMASLMEAFPETPAYASAETLDIMRSDANGFIAMTKAVLGSDAPDTQPLPTKTFRDGQELRFGDIVLVVDEIGRGEAGAMTMFYAPDRNYLFTGDVVDNGMTSFMMEGHTLEWLAQLTEIGATYADRDPVIFPGHGADGDMALFDAQRELIAWLHAEVGARLSVGLTAADIDGIAARYERRYPDHPPVAAVPELMKENIRAVTRELQNQ